MKCVISFSVQLANIEHRFRHRGRNPETTAVSGFCYTIFQGRIQKISFPKNGFRGGLELNSTDIKGRFYD